MPIHDFVWGEELYSIVASDLDLQPNGTRSEEDVWNKFDVPDDFTLDTSLSAWADDDWEHDDKSHDWDDVEKIIVGHDVNLSQGLRYAHDCMWSGSCLSEDCKPNRTLLSPTKSVPPQLPRVPIKATCGANNTMNSIIIKPCAVNSVSNNNNISFSNKNPSVCNSGSSSTSNISNNVVCNSSSQCNVNASVIGSNNTSVLAIRTQPSVVQTIQVPSVSGPRRTGVIVQKTVGRSLLIRSRTKQEVNGPTVNNNNNSTAVSNLLQPATMTTAITTSTPIKTPSAPMVARQSSRPETPQSLSESEDVDDTCPLDPSLFLNLDNLRPPQGDLWDEVLASLEEEYESRNEPPAVRTAFAPPATRTALEEPDEKVTKTAPPESPVKSESPDANTNVAAASVNTTVVNDHSYGKNSWIRMDDLGVQTPSDSEEEIDVVSLFERTSSQASNCSSSSSSSSSSNSSCSSRSSSTSSSPGAAASSLPTKPSPEDQEELQELTASKLLSAASKAVSKRLKSKFSNRGRQPGKRRRSSDDYDETVTRTKKPRSYTRHYKPARSRFATAFEPDSKEKRHLHNNMERMRRVDLRNSFEDLRALVPTLVNKERAPKVLILQDAAMYCTDLKIQSRQLATQVAALRKEQERLRATVSTLRRSLAASR